jgi:hypothetical protein
MPYDENWNEVPSAMALLDEQEHAKRIRNRAGDVAKNRPPAPLGVTRAQLNKTLATLCEGIVAMIGAEIEKLRLRIEELEAQNRLKYVGPWKEGGDYLPGQLVSYGGGMWHCRAHTGTRPNKCHEAWQLAVKSSR